ncbi:MAG: hypothetical protein H0V72_06980 [Bradyrhizobium sp.]|nr:hypothetical protein [Bradyrhizobium sp.]
MKKSEAKSQPLVSEELEAPVRLTPDQLEIVAAGFAARISVATVKGPITGTATTGLYPWPQPLFGLPTLKQM